MPLLSSSLSRRVAALALVLAAALPAPFAGAAEADGHLSGRLVNSSGKPLAGATVTATDPVTGARETTAADKNGRYQLAVAAGGYDLEVNAGPTLKALVNGVTVGADTKRDVLVVPHAVRFEGTLRNSAGEAIPDAWVRLDDPGTETDSEGRFSLRSTPGSHKLFVDSQQFVAWVEHYTLGGDTDADLVIPTVPVEVNVRDEAGHTVDDVRIRLNAWEDQAPFELVPGKKTGAYNRIEIMGGASAHVEFDALPTAGPVVLQVSPPGDSPLRAVDLTIDPLNGPRRIDVVLPWRPRPGDPPGPDVTVSGTVRNLDGTVPTGETGVTLSATDGDPSRYVEVHNGTFSLSAPPGTYQLTVRESNYNWHDDEDGSDHDGYDLSATIDEFHLDSNKTVDLRLPFAPADITVVDHLGQSVTAAVTATTRDSDVELLPGATGKAQINLDKWVDTGRTTVKTLPGRPSDVVVRPDDQALAVYDGRATPTGNLMTVQLPTPIPVRITHNVDGQTTCPYLEVNGLDGQNGPRWPGDASACTVGLQAGEYSLSSYNDDWGDSGDVEFEWYWIDAKYTVTGPATLNLDLPASNRAQVEVVNAAGNPLGGVLTMDSATEHVDLGSGIEATVVVKNRYLDEGDAKSMFDAHLFVPTTFSGTFRSERGPYQVSFSGLPLSPKGHLTIAHPVGEASSPNLPALEATAIPGGVHLTWPGADDGGSPITEYQVFWETYFTYPNESGTVTVPGSAHEATIAGLTPGSAYRFEIVARSALGESDTARTENPIFITAAGSGTTTTTAQEPGITPPPDPTPGTSVQPDTPAGSTTTKPSGYWALSSDGNVYNFGAAPQHGKTGASAIDLEPSPTGRGYWTLNRNGQVQALGDAVPLGDVNPGSLGKGEVPASLSATPSGKGYWVFTNRGRAIPFGDASFLGDVSTVKLNGPVLGSVATPTGRGYYMVASDGGIFTFGDAEFIGSMGSTKLNAPVQSLVPDSDGTGYWLVASDGGIFAFDAPFKGSLGDVKLNKPVIGMVRYGDGYLMVGADGGIFTFSSLPFSGSLGDKPPASPVVAVAALPSP